MKKQSRIKSIGVITAAGLLSVLLSVSVMAFERGQWPRGGKDHQRKAFSQLNLTSEQQTQIKAIIAKYQPQTQEVRKKMREQRKAARVENGNGLQTEEEMRAAFQKNVPLMEDAFVLRQKMRNEIHAVLTPEQVSQLDKKRAEMQKRRMQHWKSARQHYQAGIEQDHQDKQ